MDLHGFLRPEVLPVREKEVVISERFLGGDGKPAAFKLRGISEEENAAIRRSCQKKGGALDAPVLDRDRYLRRFAAACVVYPDLKDGELQASWGVMGEDMLLGKMLTAGEFARLLAAAQEVCGFIRADEAGKVKDELKNASGGETGN